MEMAWRNIQHNEALRNVLLTIYLTVTAGFFVVLRFVDAEGTEAYLSLLAAFIVSLIGLLFSWVFMRFQRMIGRDNEVIAAARTEMSRYTPLRPIVDIYEQYFNQSRGFPARFPVTVAFIVTVWITASGVLALSIFQVSEIRAASVFGVFAGSCVLHIGAFALMTRIMGTPVYKRLSEEEVVGPNERTGQKANQEVEG